jgi:hypothetical protein
MALGWLSRNRLQLLRWLVIAAVVAAAGVVTPKTVQGHELPGLLVAAFFAGLLLLVVLRWPAVGIMLVILGAAFAPQTWQGGLNPSHIGLGLMFGIWIVDQVVIERCFQPIHSRVLWPASAFIVISILALGLGQVSWYPTAGNAPLEVQFGGFAIHVLSVGALLLMPHVVDNTRELEWLTWSFIAIGLVYVLGRSLHLSWPDRIYQRGFTAGSMFWTWLTALLVGQVLGNQRLRKGPRLLLAAGVLLVFYVALDQGYDWRSGWLPPLISMAAIVCIRYWRQVRLLAGLGLLPLYSLLTTSIGEEGWSWATRLEAWRIVLRVARVSPVLGTGFANYYWYTPLFPIQGYFLRFNSHSQIVDLIAQTGLLGLASFVWLIGEVGGVGLRLLHRAPVGFGRGYVYGALGGLAGTLVAAMLVDWVLPFVYNIGMTGFRASVLAWIFMGGLISLQQQVERPA